jgi:hypothetical protein
MVRYCLRVLVRFFQRVLALLLMGGAIFFGTHGLQFRMDSWNDMLFISCVDMILGFLFVLLVLFVFGRRPARVSWKRGLRLVALAVLFGVGVSGPLLYLHWDQYSAHMLPEMPEKKLKPGGTTW